MKRRRPPSAPEARPPKRARHDGLTHPVSPVLQRFYPVCLTLRHYLLAALSGASTRKRRRIAHLGLTRSDAQHVDALRRLLDNTLVACHDHVESPGLERELQLFSQHQPTSTIASTSSTTGTNVHPGQQSEIVDFVIWSLFRKHPNQHRPPHVLCHGFQRASCSDQNIAPRLNDGPGIPGITPVFPNSHVETVKGPPWSTLLVALGRGGDRVMMDLLKRCAVFVLPEGANGSCYQLSGKPLTDIEPIPPQRCPTNQPLAEKLSTLAPARTKPKAESKNDGVAGLTAITFVRSRMLYARAALNAKGTVRFGLRHIHVLNRFPDCTSLRQTIHIMKHIFPRQFGLHNVFTSKTDYKDTSQPFKDYTVREEEIARDRLRKIFKKGQKNSKTTDCIEPIPKRLRGQAIDLVLRFRTLHHRCSYTELLRHYCSNEGDRTPKNSDHASKQDSLPKTMSRVDAVGSRSSEKHDQDLPVNEETEFSIFPSPSSLKSAAAEQPFTDLATPAHQVSAFCRAIVSSVIPNDFWGEGATGEYNKHLLMRQIDRFVCLRRYESLTLHEVLQDMKIAEIAWLRPSNVRPGTKMSITDFTKRQEIFQELVYYIFDSFLILLIRSNFHVTESNVDKNRLFYFRHDIWKSLSEPALADIKATMLEEMSQANAMKILASRSLGHSQVRLLPKRVGARPITNLRRRLPIQVNGKTVLGRSINSVMRPVFTVLNYEKSTQPQSLGSSLFSVGDMYPRLKAFRSKLEQRDLTGEPLYFVKVDVKSCFDTIPQKRLVQLIKRLLSLDEYRVARHAEVQAAGPHQYSRTVASSIKPIKKFISRGRSTSDTSDFADLLRIKASLGGADRVFVDSVVEQTQTRRKVLELLTEHVERNMIKIGKKYYRQKNGIPQGSVLSSLLCNFFYAELEAKLLDFLSPDSSILLRLIDDSLLITTERTHAERFLQIMYDGNEDYGVSIKKAKTLVNFDTKVQGSEVSRLASGTSFPYCGTLIDTGTLDISKEVQQRDSNRWRDSLTVEFSKLPGQTFHRKTLNGLKIQLHGMFLDTGFNSVATVLGNLFRSFLDAAQKCFQYIKSLPAQKRSCDRLLIKTVNDVAGLAAGLMRKQRARSRAKAWADFECQVNRRHGKWSVFQRRQTKYPTLLRWLDANLLALRPRCRVDGEALERAAAGVGT